MYCQEKPQQQIAAGAQGCVHYMPAVVYPDERSWGGGAPGCPLVLPDQTTAAAIPNQTRHNTHGWEASVSARILLRACQHIHEGGEMTTTDTDRVKKTVSTSVYMLQDVVYCKYTRSGRRMMTGE